MTLNDVYKSLQENYPELKERNDVLGRELVFATSATEELVILSIYPLPDGRICFDLGPTN